MVGTALLTPEVGIAAAGAAGYSPMADRVVVRLHGRADDVSSVAARLRIDLEWGRAERRPGDVCSVDGTLADSRPRLLL